MFRNTEAYLLKFAALSITLATSIAITLFSLNEFGYDRFHENARHVFRVIKKNLDDNCNGNTLSSKIDKGFINAVTKQHKDSIIISRIKILKGVTLFINGEVVYDQKLHTVDTTIDRIFSLDVINGNIKTFKTGNNASIIISSEFAEKHWGKTNIAGKN